MTLAVQTELRVKSSASHLRQLRKNGLIPGIVYGKDIDNVLISVSEKQLHPLLSQRANAIINLQIPGFGEKKAIMKEVQKYPFSDRIRHVDFHVVREDERIYATVPVKFVGVPVGIKQGGVRTIMLDEIELKCTPAQLPEVIKVDISHLGIGSSIHAGELDIPKGTELLTDKNSVLITITSHSKSTNIEETTGQAAVEAAASSE